MTNSRKKGIRGEQVILKCLMETLNIDPSHKSQRNWQSGSYGGYENADLRVEGLETFHIECKNEKTFSFPRYRKQLQDDIQGMKTPILIHLHPGAKEKRWAIPLRLGQKVNNYEPWIHTPLATLENFVITLVEAMGWEVTPREK